MRKGRRFTPALLEKWQTEGRGTGIGNQYLPWHQVTRADPSSRGRSHLLNWKFERLHHLLSDQELVAFGLATMLPHVSDVREQYALRHQQHAYAADAYQTRTPLGLTAGTLQIADELGYAHPMVRANGHAAPWVMSTDLLITMSPNKEIELLAVSIKHDDELLIPRKRELLEIERGYWLRQGVCWLLITPSLYAGIESAVRAGMAWATCADVVPTVTLDRIYEMRASLDGLSLHRAHRHLCETLQLSQEEVQRAMWQSVWCGNLPIDLGHSLRPSEPIALLSDQAFWLQNPIASRRSAWTD